MVDPAITRRMEQIGKALEEMAPDTVEEFREKFEGLRTQEGLRDYSIAVVQNYFDSRKDVDSELGDALLFGMIGVFVYTHKKDRDTSFILMTTFLIDLEEVNHSTIAHRLFDLRECFYSLINPLITFDNTSFWNISKSFIRSYKEFLGTIYSYLIICLKTTLGEGINKEKIVHGLALSRKAQELKRLSDRIKINGDPISTLLKYTDTKLRNSIAHNSIWHDETSNLVYYRDERNNQEYDIRFEDYVQKVEAGLTLYQAYFAAIFTLRLLGEGVTPLELPKELFMFITLLEDTIRERQVLESHRNSVNYNEKDLIDLINKKLPLENKGNENYFKLLAFLIDPHQIFKLEELSTIIDKKIEIVLKFDKDIARGLLERYDDKTGLSLHYRYILRKNKLPRVKGGVFFNHCDLVRLMIDSTVITSYYENDSTE